MMKNSANAPRTPSVTSTRIVRFGVIPAVLFLLFTSISCSFKEPVLPTWTVPVNIPLSEETFNIGDEIVNDSTIVTQGGDSTIYIAFDGNMDPLELSAGDFAIDAIDTVQTFELDTLHLDHLDELNTGLVSLRTIYPDLGNLIPGGGSIPITMPDTTFFPPPVELNAGDFVGIHVTRGNIIVQFTNNMPFPIGPNPSFPNGAQITLFDSTNTQVAQVTFDQAIAPGEQAVSTIPLGNGVWVYAPLHLEFVLPIAQQTTFTLNDSLLDNAGVSINVTLDQMEADEVIAVLDAQHVNKTLSFNLNSDNRIREAVIEQGNIRLNFSNQTDLNTRVVFRIQNFLTPQNEPLLDSVSIAGRGTTEYTLPLNGMRIANALEGEDFIDSLEVDYQTYTEATSNLVHIRSTDYVSIHVQVDSILFQSFSGYLAGESFEIDPIEKDSVMDYNSIPDNIRLSQVDLALTLSNEVYIENLSADLFITGYHKDENGVITDSAQLVIANQDITPGQPGNPGITVISLSGEEVANFLNILPNTIRSSGRISASGNVNISNSASIAGHYAFSTPLKFRINGEAYIKGDVQELQAKDISQDIRESDDKNFQEATLQLHLMNATPLGGSARIIVSADPYHTDIYDTTGMNSQLEFSKEITIQPAQTDPVTGFVTQPSENSIELSLTREEFRIFKNPPLRIGYELRIADTNGDVTVRAMDFVQISGIANVMLVVTN